MLWAPLSAPLAACCPPAPQDGSRERQELEGVCVYLCGMFRVCGWEPAVLAPSPQLRVTPWDFFPPSQVRSLARTDEARGLLWLLEEEALVPGATEDTLLQRLFSYYGPQEGDKKGGWPWRAAPHFLS